MKLTGVLHKMTFINKGNELTIKPGYKIELGEEKLDLCKALGRELSIKYLGKITCASCGKNTKKSYGQGFCYPCFILVPQTEECVFHPELCRAHEGVARDMDYAKKHCLVDQYVYLALSGGLKVGVTRNHQIPVRWVDQGAVKAIKLVITKNRYLSGLVEVELKKVFADKTNWRKMLTGNDHNQNLIEKKQIALNALRDVGLEYTEADDLEYSIEYPIESFPAKVVALSLDKDAEFMGALTGIKGQYLLFRGGKVINLRKHTGYHVDIEVL